MSITRSTHTLIAVLATAAALVAIALTGTARAAGDPLAQERYYSSHGSPAADAALAQEQHYSSYGQPAPLSLPSAPAPDGESPSVPIIAVVAGGVLVIGATAAGLRRLRVRRRGTRVLT